MRTLSGWLAVLLFLGTVAAVPSVAKSGGGCGTLCATITVWDTDKNASATLMQSDDYNGTGHAVYTTTGGVNSLFYNGTLFLDLYSQTTRKLYITPNDPYAPPSNPPVPIPPAEYYAQYGEMYVSCYDQNNNLVPLQNITSSSGTCRLGVDFGYNGVKYKLDMGPVQPAPGPSTSDVLVTCNTASGGVCGNWTITPNPNNSPANVANLYYYAKGGKLTYLGQYLNTFRIDVSQP